MMVYMPDYPGPKVARFYVLEYRIVAEKKLGRALLPGEVVHHIDGDIHNNNPDNLDVMTQSAHAAIHDQTRNKNKKGQYAS